jgi:hypothetical protein
MKANEVIEKIKVMLGVEMKKHQFQATKTLVDGTEVYVEGEFAVGEALFVITEEGLIAAPQGDHETSDGFIVSVDDAGIITAIEPKEGEELPQVEEVEANEDYEDEKPDDMVIINETTENELVEAVVEAIKPLIDEIVEMKKELGKYKEKMEKFSKEPAAEPIKSERIGEYESAFQKRLKILTENKKSV